ncbi:hypothetical protein CLIB1423_18S00738 [[Candida] railenensis]|uniref:Transcriptional regulatory protein DEP1 n=1 Tax=[Candida] railenensis TaxID=45579 RepID=A0A9P0QTV2_9ASCO|nr:hypothetical protein CLIB1423_18S00738 [[Candida] railenensis]
MSIEETTSTGATPPPSYTNKESPLTDIATSPPPFSLPLDEDIEEQLEESVKNGGATSSNNNNSNDDSSELSDLGDEDSEAETDKMDFLEDEGNSSLDHTSSDLHALSKLTELAQLKEIDDDLDDEGKPENFNIGKGESDEEADREREDDDDDDEEVKKENGNGSANGRKRTIDESEVGQWKKQKPEDIDSESIDVDVKEEDPSSKEEEHETDKPAIENNEIHAAGEDEDQDIADAGAKKDGKKEEQDVESSEQTDLKVETSDKESDADEEGEGAKESSMAALVTADEDLEAADAEVEAEAAAEEEAELEAEAEAEVEDEDEDDVDDTEDTENAGKRNRKLEKEDGANSPGAESDEEDNDEVDMNEQRKLAIKELVSVETDFANLRDKLYHDKLQLLEHELKLCLEGSHPELSKIYYKVNGFYQDSLKYANSNLNYKLRCIDRQTIATRTAIHQDFLKSIMDYKNEMISNTTSLWYKINKERNQMDQLVPEYNFSAIPQVSAPVTANGTIGNDEDSEIAPVIPLPKKVIRQRTLVDLVQRRNDFNHEVGIQGGLLEFHGFPSAITSKLADLGSDDGPAVDDIEELILRKATEEEIQDDLRGMGILT